VYAEASAQVDVYELEENSEKVTRLNNVFSRQKENSHVVTSGITLHNGYTRNNYHFRLEGEYAEAHVGGTGHLRQVAAYRQLRFPRSCRAPLHQQRAF